MPVLRTSSSRPTKYGNWESIITPMELDRFRNPRILKSDSCVKTISTLNTDVENSHKILYRLLMADSSIKTAYQAKDT